MSVINLTNMSSVTHSYTNTLNGVNMGTGSGSNSHDENFSSYYGYSIGGSDAGYTTICITEHTLPTTYTLSQIKYRYVIGASASGSYRREFSILGYVQYYNGSWNDVTGSRYSTGGGDGSASYDTGSVTVHGTWANVTKLRCYTYAYGLATGGEGSFGATSYIYEIDGFGEQYKNIGLRYRKGSTTYTIACEGLLSTSKLRIRRGGVTYGIPTVATGDPLDNGLRVQIGGTTYGLINYT